MLDGTNLLHGFKNRDVRGRLFPPVKDPLVNRRQSHAIGRLLKGLHVRGLTAEMPNTQRWRITNRGQTVLGACVRLHYHGLGTAA